eukprot:m.102071 g.102071  ORF g.102071 m.102071 type:complete len:289 (+) comp27381_c0_seq2:84-950(+)
MVVDNLRRTLLKATGDLGDLDTIKNLPQDIHNAVLETTVLAETITTMDTSQMLPGWALAAISFISACAMTFGGVVPFIPQYLLIRRTRSCEGFNTFMCFSLLTANILRILFWFGHPFEFPLLAQSILMVVAMLFLMNACVEGCYDTGGRNIRIYDGVLAEFWKWTDYADYLLYIASFTVFFGTLTYLLVNVAVYVETLGFAAVFIEAIQAIPQWRRNHRAKSTQGMSVVMIACMCSGDLFKTGYFIARSAPAQFAVCGMLQVTVDIAIMFQVWRYRGTSPVITTKVVP